ncbi:hypothetical protein [Calothrix sp. 336/3]|uniref:hypothetical protein n=1 Tax=Calothrix sp. 336/3 TaxID=1337936 RepID=UPI0004E29010|nr:hypothetical protein [Calothrix sp. 336/3]AKG19981.1 hypothetical protein IJ00_00425 [Calothrix sp. 336/3]
MFTKSEAKKSSILPLFVVITFSVNVLTLLILLFHGSLLQELGKRLTPQSLVQLIDGRAITVDPKVNLERHPETIRRFVGETMTLMLTWSSKQPPKTIWETVYGLMTDEIKQKLKAEIITLNPSVQFENTNRVDENVFVIERISQPKQLTEGKWQVEISGYQLNFSSSDQRGKSIKIHKQILVRSTEEQNVTLPNLPLPWHLAAYRIGEAKLEIYQMCDGKDTQCAEKK